MTRYKQIFELKNAAKDRLDGRYTGAILIFVMSALINRLASSLIDSIGGTTLNSIANTSGSMTAYYIVTAVFYVLLVIADIICAVMNAGIALYFLNLACGQPFSFINLFYGFQNDSKKSLIIASAMVLCQVVCLWPFQYMIQNLVQTRDISWLYYALPALVVGLCVYVPISLGISLSFYLMLDFPQYSAKEILSLCWRTMRGQRRRLFLLELSFLPLMLLCVLSFGIGLLWLQPYMQMTYTFFFLDLMNPGKSTPPPQTTGYTAYSAAGRRGY